MARCTAFGIAVPISFPLGGWENLYGFGGLAPDGQHELQGELIRAMGYVVYRYKTCREAIDSMVAYWHGSGQTPTFDGYYTMQRDTFSFFYLLTPIRFLAVVLSLAVSSFR